MTDDDAVLLVFSLMTFLSSGFLLVTSVGKCVSSFQPDRVIILSLALAGTLLAPFCLTIIVKNSDTPPYKQDDPISMLLANYVIYFEITIYCIGLIELAVELALRNKLKFLLRSKTIRWIVSLVAGSFPWIVVILMARVSPRGVDPNTWQNDQSVTLRSVRMVYFNFIPAVLSIFACTLVQYIRPNTHGLKKQPTDESIQIQVIANAPDKDLVSDCPTATLPPPVTNFELTISQGVQPAGQLCANDPAVMNLRAFTAYADEKAKDTPSNRQQDTQANRKQDTQANRQQDTQANRKQDTQANRKQDTQADRKQDTQANRKQDTQANRQQCELISICALAEKMSVKIDQNDKHRLVDTSDQNDKHRLVDTSDQNDKHRLVDTSDQNDKHRLVDTSVQNDKHRLVDTSVQNDKHRLVDTSDQNVQCTPTAFTETAQKVVLLYSAIVPLVHMLRCICWLVLDAQGAIVDVEAAPSDGLGIFHIKGVLCFFIAVKAFMMTPFVMSFWYL